MGGSRDDKGNELGNEEEKEKGCRFWERWKKKMSAFINSRGDKGGDQR